MGQPVVHFEIIGKDGEKLRSYYSELFGWAKSLGGTRMMDPDKVPEVNIEIGLFTDPEGHVIGLVK